MDINWNTLNKIPLFKNVDFEDKRSRMRVAMFFFGAALFFVVLILLIIPSAEKKVDVKDGTAIMEIPEGQDFEQPLLDSDDMLTARGRLNPGNKDIFLESAPRIQGQAIFLSEEKDSDSLIAVAEDPMPGISKQDPISGQTPVALPSAAESKLKETKEERRARAMDIFGMSDEKETPASATASSSVKDEPKYESRAQREQEPEPEPEQRYAPSSSKKQKPTKKVIPTTQETPAASQASSSSSQQQEEQAAPQRFRRSGGISSVDDDWGTIEGLSSLDNDNMYIEDDLDHPYKVVFVRDQKLRSGDRVTLRLMEDLIVDNVMIPKNTHIYGVCSIGDRLMINVNTLEVNGKFYTLSMSAYDSDGAEGIYCPETASQEAAQQTKQQVGSAAGSVLTSAASIVGTAFGSPYLGNALGSLTNTGASLITSKNGSTTVQVRSGYMFYILKEAN